MVWRGYSLPRLFNPPIEASNLASTFSFTAANTPNKSLPVEAKEGQPTDAETQICLSAGARSVSHACVYHVVRFKWNQNIFSPYLLQSRMQTRFLDSRK